MRLRLNSLELARRRRDERIRYFKPNGGQKLWIDEISRPGAFIVVNASGNGGGKTYGLVAIMGAIMWPALAPASLKSTVLQDWKYPKRLRIVSTPKEIEEIGSLQTTISELWPKGRYDALKKGKSYPSQFKSDTNFVVDLMTYEQDKSEFAGPNLGLIAFNEPMPRPIWDECLARTRKGGIVLVAMTSLHEHPWVVDGILGKHDGNQIRVLYSDVEENCLEHGTNGYLSHAQVEKILGQYDPDERESRKTGKPLSMSGRIYKAFDRAVHVASDITPNPEMAVTRYMVVDPAIGKPCAAIWAYVDGTGLVSIYDEWPDFDFEGSKDSNLAVSDYITLFKAKEEGKVIATRIMDRHFGNVRRTMGGLTLKQEFQELGQDYQDSYHVGENEPEIETGIMKVKEFLKYDKAKKIDGLNRPRIRISANCKNTIASFEKWSRDPKTYKPKDEYKDFADCVRYLIASNPELEIQRNWGTPTPAHYGVS